MMTWGNIFNIANWTCDARARIQSFELVIYRLAFDLLYLVFAAAVVSKIFPLTRNY